jgi:hypothetical protein
MDKIYRMRSFCGSLEQYLRSVLSLHWRLLPFTFNDLTRETKSETDFYRLES